MNFAFLCIFGTLLVLEELRPCQAVTCNALTGYTCTKSKYVTGVCSSGVCRCVSGAVPNNFGCFKQFKPEIYVFDQDWSGEAKMNDFVSFGCDFGQVDPFEIENFRYYWYLDGEELPENSTSLRHQVTTSDTTLQFQCALDVYGHLSERSDAFSVKVPAEDKEFTLKPTVEGMVTYATLGSTIRLYCKNLPSGWQRDGWISWKIGDVSTSWKSVNYLDLQMSADNFNQPISCLIQIPIILISESVQTPSAPIDDIPNVVVKGYQQHYYEGKSLKLTCDFEDTISLSAEKDVIYTWSGPPDGYVISGATSKNYSKDHITTDDTGTYFCSASYKNKPSKTAMLNVVVDTMPKIDVEITFTPQFPVIGGYQALTCNTPGRDSSNLQFSWYRIGRLSGLFELAKSTDNVLQMNNIPPSDYSNYFCYVKFNGIVAEMDKLTAPPVPISSVKPTPIVFDGDDSSFKLRCHSDTDTPGRTSEWYLDGVKQSRTYNEITVTMKDDSKTDVTCSLFFNGKSSAVSNITTIPAKGSVLPPEVQIKTQRQTFYLGASYELLCFSPLDVGQFTFSWKKGSTQLAETSKNFKFLSMQEVDNGDYTCTISQGLNSATSLPIQVKISTNLEAETSVLARSPTMYVGEYIGLDCKYEKSLFPDSFVWKKGTTILSVNKSYIRFEDIQVKDSGSYSCALKIGQVTSTGGKPTSIVVKENGKYCAYSSDCTGPGFKAGVCVNKECQCMPKYKFKGSECVMNAGNSNMVQFWPVVLMSLVVMLFTVRAI